MPSTGSVLRRFEGELMVYLLQNPERPGSLVLPDSQLVWSDDEAHDYIGLVIHILYMTFASSQGRQWAQPGQILFILLRMRQAGIVLTDATLDRLEEEIVTRRPPKGHIVIPVAARKRVFRFWAQHFVSIARFVYTGNPRHLPDQILLPQQVDDLGGECWHTSFTDEEVGAMIVAFANMGDLGESDLLTPEVAMMYIAGPHALKTELRWVGQVFLQEELAQEGEDVQLGRPRTDDGDPFAAHMTRYMDQAIKALGSYEQVSPWHDFYLCLAVWLEKLRSYPDHPLYELHAELVDAFNTAHPDAPVERFHPVAA